VTHLDPVPPHIAGARIRVLAKQLLEALRSSDGGNIFYPSVLNRDDWLHVQARFSALEGVLGGRKVTELRAAELALRDAVNAYKRNLEKEATTQIVANRQAVWNAMTTSEGRRLLRVAEEIFSLSNNLPTQSDLPTTDSRDTALRAIIAILRTHEFPGAEHLTHHAKEDHAEEEETFTANGDEVTAFAAVDTDDVDEPF